MVIGSFVLGEIELALLLGAFLAAFVAGAAGFGDALAAGAVWLHVFPPAEAAPLIVFTGLAVHILAYARLHKELDTAHLAPFLGLGALGVPFGAYLLTHVAAEPLRLAVGGFLIVYGLGLFLMRDPPAVVAGGKKLDAVAGGIGGVLGGMIGMSGAAPALWCGLRGWDREKARGVSQPYILVMHVLSLAAMAHAGLVSMETLERFAWGLPAVAAGTLAGVALYRLLDEQLFRRQILLILAVAGVTLVI